MKCKPEEIKWEENVIYVREIFLKLFWISVSYIKEILYFSLS